MRNETLSETLNEMLNETNSELLEIANNETGRFDRRELVLSIVHELGISFAEIDEITACLFRVLREQISKKQYVEIHKFGSFRVKSLAAEQGLTPNGTAYQVGERVTVDFNPFKALRDEVTAKTGYPSV